MLALSLASCSDNSPDTPDSSEVTTEMPETTSPDTTFDTTEAVTEDTTTLPDDDITYVIDQEQGVLYEGDTVIHTLAEKSSAEMLNRVSKDSFTEPIEFDYNGKKITIEPPVFTGLTFNSVESYKDHYYFYDGSTVFNLSSSNGRFYVEVNKDGKIIDAGTAYSAVKGDRTVTKYIELTTDKVDLGNGLGGFVRGDDVAIVSDDGLSYLYSVTTGERLSSGYNKITYFYNGLALVKKDNMIGIIDDEGNELLSPCIKYDTITYPPTGRQYTIAYMFEDAFVLPIGGEFAIINISRGN